MSGSEDRSVLFTGCIPPVYADSIFISNIKKNKKYKYVAYLAVVLSVLSQELGQIALSNVGHGRVWGAPEEF